MWYSVIVILVISRNCCNEQYLSICLFIYLIFVLSVFLLAILFYYPSIFCVVNKFYFKYHFIFEKSLCFFSSVFARLRAVSLFSWSVQQNARDTQMTTRVTVCEEKEKLLAVPVLSGLPRLHIVKNPRVRTYNFFNSGRRKKKVLVFWGSYRQLRLSRFLVSMKEI